MQNENIGLTELLANQLEAKNEGLSILLMALSGDYPESAGQLVENNFDWLSGKTFVVGESESDFSCQLADGVNLEFEFDLDGLNTLVKYKNQPNKLLVLSNFDADVQQELSGLLSHFQDTDIKIDNEHFTLVHNDQSAEIKFGTKIKDVSNIVSEELRYRRGNEEFRCPSKLSEGLPA